MLIAYVDAGGRGLFLPQLNLPGFIDAPWEEWMRGHRLRGREKQKDEREGEW